MPDFNALRSAIEKTRIIATPAESEQLRATLVASVARPPLVLDFFNQHAGNLVMGDAKFRGAFLAADIILRDGIGVRLAMSMLGRNSGLNMNGTDFIPVLINAFSQQHTQLPIMFFGTEQPWLQRGSQRLAAAHRGPIVVVDGFQNAEDYCCVAKEHAHTFKLIVLGMGMPKQEFIAQQLKQAGIGPAIIVCGGAIIDFAAGKVTRAPSWIRALGLEWLYRLANEPRRLFKRYVFGIPVFLSCVVMSRFQVRQR